VARRRTWGPLPTESSFPTFRGFVSKRFHSLDVGDAYRRALLCDVRGAFNIAADPPIGLAELAQILKARPVKLPARILRGAAAATFALRLQPSEPEWLDMVLAFPPAFVRS
jgi:hypothetical protein